MEHLNIILDALGREINRLNGVISTRDWQLQEANEQRDANYRNMLEFRGRLSEQTDERVKDQVIMTQAAKLVGKLLDQINRGEVAAAPYVRDALDNILAVLADAVKEES